MYKSRTITIVLVLSLIMLMASSAFADQTPSAVPAPYNKELEIDELNADRLIERFTRGPNVPTDLYDLSVSSYGGVGFIYASTIY